MSIITNKTIGMIPELKTELNTLANLVCISMICRHSLINAIYINDFNGQQEHVTANLNAKIKQSAVKQNTCFQDYDDLIKLQIENTKLKHRFAIIIKVSLYICN